MADTFGDLRTELAARGTDYLDQTRAGRFLNRGYAMLCEEYPWDFLETELTAQTAPVAIDDLREIIYVTSATEEICEADQRAVAFDDPGRIATGPADSWYLTGQTLNLYPADTSAVLTIRYVRVPDELTNETDEPLIPQRYRNLIVDAAYYLALKDNDEFAAAQELKNLYDQEVQKMVSRYAVRSLQRPKSIA